MRPQSGRGDLSETECVDMDGALIVIQILSLYIYCRPLAHPPGYLYTAASCMQHPASRCGVDFDADVRLRVGSRMRCWRPSDRRGLMFYQSDSVYNYAGADARSVVTYRAYRPVDRRKIYRRRSRELKANCRRVNCSVGC
jgi:hypothetical protein